MIFRATVVNTVAEAQSVAEVIDSVRLVGRETGFAEEGLAEAARLEAGFEKIREVVSKVEQEATPSKKKKVAFLEWLEPLFNGGHWVPDLVRGAGGEYTMAEPGNKSVGLTAEDLAAYDADIILVAPCGMDRKRAISDGEKMWRHDWWRELRAVKDGQVYALDGNAYYARPGPRLLQGCGIIARLLHGDAVGDAIGEDIAPRDSSNIITEPPPASSPSVTTTLPQGNEEERPECLEGVGPGIAATAAAAAAAVAVDAAAPAAIKA